MSIKTPDLCERCVHSTERCCYSTVGFCPMCLSQETDGCKCLTIKPNTPCPYFEEVKDDNGD